MNLESIIAISGFPGLYKVIGQSSNGLIVEAIESKKRLPIYASHKVSALEDICIYTETEEKPLAEVFKGIFETYKGKEALPASSASEELKSFFEKALPDYDRDRVYVSDIKKVVRWYNELLGAGFIQEEKKETKKEDKKPKKEAKEKGSTAKKATTAKTAAAKTTTKAKSTTKKTTTKK